MQVSSTHNFFHYSSVYSASDLQPTNQPAQDNRPNEENNSVSSSTPTSHTRNTDEFHASDEGKTQAISPEEQLTEEQLKEIEQLKKRDREVKAHELAHLAAAGQYANGGISLEYQTGPDGKRYASSGEVSIDTSEIPGDPHATLRKANRLRAAALAPAEPSSADRSIAQQAIAMAVQAQADILEMKSEERQQRQESNKTAPTSGEDKNASNKSTYGDQQPNLGELIDRFA